MEKEVEELSEESEYFGVPYMRESLEPEVIQRRLKGHKYTFSAILIGALFAVGVYLCISYLEFSLQEAFIVGLVVLAVYAGILFFLLEPGIEREIRQTTIERYKSPEKIREVTKTIPVVIKEKKKKLNIPKYKFIGSSQTRTYHKRNCRLCKSIKRKYKESSNQEAYFKKRKYHACKICLGSKRKKKKK